MEILCPKCRKKYRVSDSLAGKRARCKDQSCGQVFTVAACAAGAPAARAASAPSPAARTPAKPAPAAGGGSAMSSLLDEFPPMPLDNLPQAGVPSVPASNYRPSRPRGSHKKKLLSPLVLILGGGVVAVLIVGCLLALVLSNRGGAGGGSANSPVAAPFSPYDYIPENAQYVACLNVDELRGSDLFAEVRKFAAAQSPQGQRDIDDLSEVYFAGCGFAPNDESLIVLRTKKDMSLQEVAPGDGRGVLIKTFQNVQYAVFKESRGGKEVFVAKTGDRTYCVATTEDMLKKTLDRLGRKQRAPLAPSLQTALDAVAGSPQYVGAINVKMPPMPFAIDRLSCRGSVGSSLRIELTLVFADAGQAAKFKQVIDGMGAMTAMMPADKKKLLDPILSALNIRQNGNQLNCEATWQNKDILALVKSFKESGGAFPGMPGAFPGQPGAMPTVPPGMPGGPPPGAFPSGPPGGVPPVPGVPGQ